jgi:hypothetical protein
MQIETLGEVDYQVVCLHRTGIIDANIPPTARIVSLVLQRPSIALAAFGAEFAHLADGRVERQVEVTLRT